MDAPVISLAGLLGLGPGEIRARLGPPDVDRPVGEERWLVYRIEELGSLRMRCAPRLASWTITFDDPRPASLRSAADALDLWPELGPDAGSEETGGRLLRREVRDTDGRPASATAAVEPDGVARIAVFDEEPDW